jgi:hypothetical protein
LAIPFFFRIFAPSKQQTRKEMDKNSSVRVVGFPCETYSKEWLDSLNDRERSEAAVADGDTFIFEDLREFQHYLNNDMIDVDNNWIYFLND